MSVESLATEVTAEVLLTRVQVELSSPDDSDNFAVYDISGEEKFPGLPELVLVRS